MFEAEKGVRINPNREQSPKNFAARCRSMLVIGTSAVIQPAASLPLVALRNRMYLIEVNPAETPLSAHAHDILRGTAAELLPKWWMNYKDT